MAPCCSVYGPSGIESTFTVVTWALVINAAKKNTKKFNNVVLIIIILILYKGIKKLIDC